MIRKLIIIGWDGRSNPIYRYYDELKNPAHMREIPTVSAIVEQYPTARYTKSDFTTIYLRDLPIS